MSGLTRIVSRVKTLFSELMHYIVGKAAKNRGEFLETVEEGEKVVDTTEDSWEGVIFILSLAITVALQFWVLNLMTIHVLARSLIVMVIIYVQVKIITLHLRGTPTEDTV